MRMTEVQTMSLHLAKKFGFVSREVVWDLLCPQGRTARYKHWSHLQKSSLFSPYVIGSGVPEYLTLSQKGKALMGEDSTSEVPGLYLAHDELVMRFYILLLKAVTLVDVWSEAELKQDRLLAMKCMGDGTVSKLPDLLFDMKCPGIPLRTVLEVERTRKSRGRYQTMRRAYQRATNVDVILFAVAETGIEEAIQKELLEGGLEFVGRDVGFFSLDDFQEKQLRATLRLRGEEIQLIEYFQGVVNDDPSSADFRRHGVRAELRETSDFLWA